MHVYEVRPRKDKRGVDLVSDMLPFGRLWYDTPDNAIGYAMHCSRSQTAVIRVYDAAGNVIETQRARWRFQRTVTIPVASLSSNADKLVCRPASADDRARAQMCANEQLQKLLQATDHTRQRSASAPEIPAFGVQMTTI